MPNLKVQTYRNHLTLTRPNQKTVAYLQQYGRNSFHLSIHRRGRTLAAFPLATTLKNALKRLVQLDLFANGLPCIATINPTHKTLTAKQTAHFAATEPRYPSQGLLRQRHYIPTLIQEAAA